MILASRIASLDWALFVLEQVEEVPLLDFAEAAREKQDLEKQGLELY